MSSPCAAKFCILWLCIPAQGTNGQITPRPPPKKRHRETASVWSQQACTRLSAGFGGVWGPSGPGEAGQVAPLPAPGAEAVAHVLGRAELGKAEASLGLPQWILPGCSCPKSPLSPQPQQIPGRIPAAGSCRMVGNSGEMQTCIATSPAVLTAMSRRAGLGTPMTPCRRFGHPGLQCSPAMETRLGRAWGAGPGRDLP